MGKTAVRAKRAGKKKGKRRPLTPAQRKLILLTAGGVIDCPPGKPVPKTSAMNTAFDVCGFADDSITNVNVEILQSDGTYFGVPSQSTMPDPANKQWWKVSFANVPASAVGDFYRLRLWFYEGAIQAGLTTRRITVAVGNVNPCACPAP